MPPEQTNSQTNQPGKSSEEGGLSKEAFAELQSSIGNLTKSIGSLTDLASRRDAEAAKAPTQDAGDDEGGEEVDDTSLEMLSRSQFRDYMRDYITETINKAIGKPLEGKINELNTRVVQSGLEQQIIDLGGIRDKNTGEFIKDAKYVDYWDWKEEMMALAKQHPSLTPERIYHLARAEGGGKAKSLDDKYAKQKEEREAKESGNGTLRKRSFGGLTPSGSSSVVKNQKMGSREAVETAFDELLARHGSDVLSS